MKLSRVTYYSHKNENCSNVFATKYVTARDISTGTQYTENPTSSPTFDQFCIKFERPSRLDSKHGVWKRGYSLKFYVLFLSPPVVP